MLQKIKRYGSNFFYALSEISVKKVIKNNKKIKDIWDTSLKVLPDLGFHYATTNLPKEAALRVRLLISSQVIFLKKVADSFQSQLKDKELTYLDVGDTDGSVRLLFKERYPNVPLDTLGVNLQKKAVENIKKIGLKAECIDAMELHKEGRTYDIVSVFETLEHLSDPIGFLNKIHSIVNHRLIISVPLVVRSRVSLRYLSPKWPVSQIPTIANNHVFELSPADLEKIFWHTGWEIETQWRVRTFPDRGLLNWVMKYAWRRISFEGWIFLSLKKNDKFSSRYVIE